VLRDNKNMCGIVGILNKKGENAVPLVETMLSCLVCRGPDGAGIATGEQIVQADSLDDMQCDDLQSSSTALGHVESSHSEVAVGDSLSNITEKYITIRN
jgi:glutamine phosphoribosylpyrophosphate amidotransferase